MKLRHAFLAATALSAFWAVPAFAVNLTIASGDTGNGLQVLRDQADAYEKASGNKVTITPMPSSTTDQFGQYKLWLAAGNSDIDVYQTDVIWAPQLSDQFVDLTAATKDVIANYLPSVVQSQTVNGKLVALPFFTDAPALYYRKDLLDKYGATVPKTWAELTKTAQMIQDKERAAGNADMWGFVWQGNSYEGLTCDALEWIDSSGGGQIVEPDGTISVNNPKAAAAIDLAHSWVGTISPPGVLAYGEEEARGVWQKGDAVFMRNWPYAYSSGQAADSPIKDKFDTATLPTGDEAGDHPAATLGGWNLAVSKYSKNPDAAIDLVKFLANADMQKLRAIEGTNLPTWTSVYDDPDVAAKVPIIAHWKSVALNAVPRPSAPTKVKYNEVSSDFWTAVHNTLAGQGTAADNLAQLEDQLTVLKGASW